MSLRGFAASVGVHEATLRKQGLTTQMLEAPEAARIAVTLIKHGHPGSLPELFEAVNTPFPDTAWLLTIDGKNYVMDSLVKASAFIELHPAATSHLSPIGAWR